MVYTHITAGSTGYPLLWFLAGTPVTGLAFLPRGIEGTLLTDPGLNFDLALAELLLERADPLLLAAAFTLGWLTEGSRSLSSLIAWALAVSLYLCASSNIFDSDCVLGVGNVLVGFDAERLWRFPSDFNLGGGRFWRDIKTLILSGMEPTKANSKCNKQSRYNSGCIITVRILWQQWDGSCLYLRTM